LVHAVLRLLGRRVDAQFICVLAFIVIAVAAAQLLKLSVVLTLLAFGMMTRHFDRQRRFVSLEFGRIGQIFVMLLFALAAAQVDLSLLPAGLFAGLALVLARYAGKAIGTIALGRLSGLSLRKSALVGLGLTPMAGLALLLIQHMATLYPEFGPQVLTIMVAAVAILEIAGPLLAQLALSLAGETNARG
jgi:Kef-type K+ transport system membrane component KefB